MKIIERAKITMPDGRKAVYTVGWLVGLTCDRCGQERRYPQGHWDHDRTTPLGRVMLTDDYHVDLCVDCWKELRNWIHTKPSGDAS